MSYYFTVSLVLLSDKIYNSFFAPLSPIEGRLGLVPKDGSVLYQITVLLLTLALKLGLFATIFI
jgi:hypothetical protein